MKHKTAVPTASIHDLMPHLFGRLTALRMDRAGIGHVLATGQMRCQITKSRGKSATEGQYRRQSSVTCWQTRCLCWSEMPEELEARVGIEPTHKGFADLSLTTWVPRPTTKASSYGRKKSSHELSIITDRSVARCRKVSAYGQHLASLRTRSARPRWSHFR